MVKEVYKDDSLGSLMYRKAKNELQWTEERAQEMFVLGCIVNTAGGFSRNPDVAPIMLSKALRRSGYRYWNEVYNISLESSGYSSPEFNLLKDALKEVEEHGKT